MVLMKRAFIVQFDFNQNYENVEFSDVLTTDYYRRGNPYKVFGSCGSSHVKIKFVLPDGIRKPTQLHLTVTDGCWSGMMDVFLNGRLKVERLPVACSDNFQHREIRLELDEHDILEHENIILMKLRDDAQMVYWLSDAMIEVTRIVPSTLVEITACTLSDMIKNGQILESVIQNFYPNTLVKIINEWQTV